MDPELSQKTWKMWRKTRLLHQSNDTFQILFYLMITIRILWSLFHQTEKERFIRQRNISSKWNQDAEIIRNRRERLHRRIWIRKWMYEMGKVSFRYYIYMLKRRYSRLIENAIMRFVNEITQGIHNSYLQNK